jgi:hypothetical protein
MRKAVAGLLYSLDGITEAPHIWQETLEDMDAGLSTTWPTTDTTLMGRVRFQERKEFWPEHENICPGINAATKYVMI